VNRLFGDADTLNDWAKGGDDVLRAGSSTGLTATPPNTLFGDAQFLLANALGGKDTLVSGSADDVLWGDGQLLDNAKGGRDKFAFSGTFGTDSVFDFRHAEDRIEINITGSNPAGQVSWAPIGSDTVITVTGAFSTGTITLVGYTSALVSGDFIFV
jgi:hypothetical protein